MYHRAHRPITPVSPRRPGGAVGSPSRRLAHAQPRVLTGLSLLILLACAYLAVGQRTAGTARGPSVVAGKQRGLNWKNLPAVLASYGRHNQSRLKPAQPASRKSASRKAASVVHVGTTGKLFLITEADLTPNSPSDEREAAYGPNGLLIAFASNGAASSAGGPIDSLNATGRYHIWIMSTDGSNPRQITGLGLLDRDRDQRQPAFSPDGNRIIYVDYSSPVLSQLGLVSNYSDPNVTPTIQQFTSFNGLKRSPTWSPAGSVIAFSTNVDPATNVKLNSTDIFTIPSNGQAVAAIRLTGGPSDPVGDAEADVSPAFSPVNPSTIYFSSSRFNSGLRIWAMSAPDGSNKVQISDPAARPGGVATSDDDHPSPSQPAAAGDALGTKASTTEAVAFQSNGPVDGSDFRRDLNIWTVAVDSSSVNNPPVAATPLETDINGGNPAVLQTSTVSSPATAGAAGVVEDVVADQEPSCARSSTGNDAANQNIAFSSQRTKDGLGTFVNVSGGPLGTNDIWVTQTIDSTPPLLVPLALGNQQFPVIAPGPQSPFFAPRTQEQGLLPGGVLKVAVVLNDQQTGIAKNGAVTVTIRDATQRSYFGRTERTDPKVVTDGIIMAEEAAGKTEVKSVPLTAWDDGPVSLGGHEQEANAVKGDGVYYCEASTNAMDDNNNPLTGDFYIDLTATDKGGNTFTYDNIWGFSTQSFQKQKAVLLVADYADGQQFPLRLSNNDVKAKSLVFPTESYYLDNPGGKRIFVSGDDGTKTLLPSNYPVPGIWPVFDVRTTTFDADVWRIQCRGDIGEDVLAIYAPRLIAQVDPAANPDGDAVPGPFRDKITLKYLTTKVTVSNASVVWASPYTGQVLAGPGTIYDAETQRRLTNYVAAGGRLCVTGKDVVSALATASLSSNGTANQFSQNTLRANLGGEIGSDFNTMIPDANDEEITPGFRDIDRRTSVPMTLHTPWNVFRPTASDQFGLTSTFGDACLNHSNTGSLLRTVGTPGVGGNGDLDVIVPVADAAGTVRQTIYTYADGGGVAAQRIEQQHLSSGAKSRVVVFGFGLEAIHREYDFAAINSFGQTVNSFFSYDNRAQIAANLRNYFETYTVSGKVTDISGKAIPNFLVQASQTKGVPGVFVPADPNVRTAMTFTDKNGFYQIEGLPGGAYGVVPAEYKDAVGTIRSLNGAYYNSSFKYVFLGFGTNFTRIATNVDFRVTPAPPGNITGRAISDKGTEVDLADDLNPVVAADRLPVLLRSVSNSLPPTATFPSGGSYAVLTTTDFGGNFSFPNAPSLVDYEIVFNPRPGVVSKGGDIPDGSNIAYGPGFAVQPSAPYDRRVIPKDDSGYLGPYNGPTPITAPIGDTLNVGDSLGNIPVPPFATLPTPTPTLVPTATPNPNATPTPLPTSTPAPTSTPGPAATPTFGPTPTSGPSPTPGATSSPTSTPGPGGTPTATPTAGPSPTPGPGATPAVTPLASPTPNTPPDFLAGISYQISVPHMDAPGIGDGTFAESAFSLPPTSPDGTPNFKLFKFNPVSQSYLPLDTGSVLTRAEGYFIRPLSQTITMKRPPQDPTRVPLSTAVTEFPVVLRRNPSLAANDPNNGYNLIGFPFDPAVYNFVDWTNSRVVMPDGRTQFATLNMAVAAGVLSGTLSTQKDGSSVYLSTTTMLPFRGYFARTYVDGVTVYLKPSKSR